MYFHPRQPRLPYDVLDLLPECSVAVQDLYSWSLVNRAFNRKATPLLYASIVVNEATLDKVTKHHPGHIHKNVAGFVIKAGFAKLPDVKSLALPFHTLRVRPDLAALVRFCVIDLQQISGCGYGDFLDLLADALRSCPNLVSFGWFCSVRNTDRILRVLPDLSNLQEVYVRRPSCPLVWGSWQMRPLTEWAYDYISSWTDMSTIVPMKNLKHVYLSHCQPNTSHLWFRRFAELTKASPVESLYFELPSMDDKGISDDSVAEFASLHHSTLRFFACGPGKVGVEGFLALLRRCRKLEKVQFAGFNTPYTDDDVRSALLYAPPTLKLVIVKEVYWQRGLLSWRIVSPEYRELRDFQCGAKLPHLAAWKPPWHGIYLSFWMEGQA